MAGCEVTRPVLFTLSVVKSDVMFWWLNRLFASRKKLGSRCSHSLKNVRVYRISNW